MSWLCRDPIDAPAAGSFSLGKMLDAPYGQGHYVLLVVLVSVGDHEDAVDVVLPQPRLHNNLSRDDPMHRTLGRHLGPTVDCCRPVEKPCDYAGKHHGDTHRGDA